MPVSSVETESNGSGALSYEPVSPWGVWLHPVRSYRSIVEGAERLRMWGEERRIRQLDIETFMTRITDTTARLEEARAEIASLRGDLVERGAALAAAEAQVRRLTAELDELKGLEQRIAEFEQALGKMEDMKRNYERRITILRRRIQDFEDLTRRNEDLAIEMEKDPEPLPGSVEARRRPMPDPGDWLQPLDI